jgi:hypothetical protein
MNKQRLKVGSIFNIADFQTLYFLKYCPNDIQSRRQ